jgi:hypothetical protein
VLACLTVVLVKAEKARWATFGKLGSTSLEHGGPNVHLQRTWSTTPTSHPSHCSPIPLLTLPFAPTHPIAHLPPHQPALLTTTTPCKCLYNVDTLPPPVRLLWCRHKPNHVLAPMIRAQQQVQATHAQEYQQEARARQLAREQALKGPGDAQEWLQMRERMLREYQGAQQGQAEGQAQQAQQGRR